MNLRESTLRQRSVGNSRSRQLLSTRGDLNVPLGFISLKTSAHSNYITHNQEQQQHQPFIINPTLANNSITIYSEDHCLLDNICKERANKYGKAVERWISKTRDSSSNKSIDEREHEMAIVDEQKLECNSSNVNNNYGTIRASPSNMSSMIALDSHDLSDELRLEYNIKKEDSKMNCPIFEESKQISQKSKKQTSKRIKRRSNNYNNNNYIDNHDELICSCDEKYNYTNQISLQEDTKQVVTLNNDLPSSQNFSSSSSKTRRIFAQQHKLVSLGERNGRSICNKHMPWFGIDVGGSLIKVVFFDPKEATREETVTLKRIRRYLKSSKPYGTTGKRDTHLEMPNCVINKRLGSLHFIRFATSQMPQFLEMAKKKRFADTINTVCATGGGAYKFEEDIKTNLGITLHKTDELDSIIYGIHYIDKYNSDRECYYLEDPLDDAKCVKVPYDFSRPYPYLVVNIGSGVSILAVYSSTSYSRISGSSIGGGTFLGLCSLLTQCKTFDEAIQLAKAGSSSKIDKLVKDIYGGDYPKFNLSGDTVASSFGHMNMAEKRKDVKREDLARALLEMVTINIGSIARMCAANEDIDRVVFIGNFLRVNQLSMKLLSYAVNYWSKGAMKALFLEHEGYFGAVGCFVESTRHLS